VKHQRHIVACGRHVRLPGGRSGEAHGAVRVHVDREDRNLGAGGAPGFVEAVGRQDQQARIRVLEIEAELVLLVSRVERSRRSRHRGRKERHDHGKTVRQGDADAVAARNSRRREPFGQGFYLIAECAVRNSKIRFGKDNGGALGRNRPDEIEQRPTFGLRSACVVI
jgi:hypothetical protein